MRSVFNVPMAGAEELARYFLICLTFIAASHVTAIGGQIRMEEFQALIPATPRWLLQLLIELSGVAVFALITVAAFVTIRNNLILRQMKKLGIKSQPVSTHPFANFPSLDRTPTEAELDAVRARRLLPTRIVQGIQVRVQNNFVAAVLSGGTTPPAFVTPPMVHWGSAGRRALDARGKRCVKVSPSRTTAPGRPFPRGDRVRSRTGVVAALHARALT